MTAPTIEESRALLADPSKWTDGFEFLAHLRAALDREAAANQGWEKTSVLLGAALARAEKAEGEVASMRGEGSWFKESDIDRLMAERDAALAEVTSLRREVALLNEAISLTCAALAQKEKGR